MDKYDATELPVQERTSNGNFALAVVLAVTCLLIGGMIADKQRVGLAVTCGVTFFAFLVTMVMLVQTGQLVSAYRVYQREKTLRAELRLQYEIYLREPAQITVQAEDKIVDKIVDKNMPNFVPARPAVSDEVRVEAYAWVMRLFKEGEVDPERVLSPESRSPDQVQAKKPKPELLEYLLSLEMVRGGGKGETLYFNQKVYNSIRKCQQAIKYGIPLRRENERQPQTEI